MKKPSPSSTGDGRAYAKWKYMMQAGEEATLDQLRRSPISVSRAGSQPGRVAM